METNKDPKTHLYAMDPATTLYTFLLKTDPSVTSVRLLGSWDNFAMTYAMERDIRRDRGQWRGCHAFKDIICDGDATTVQQPRSGGLKMGHTYYYYYEVDGSTETHDPAAPSTSTCPYLPGQRVNTLWMPVEQSSRQRRASVNSLRPYDFQTRNPDDKFMSPRRPPATPRATTPLPTAGLPELKPRASSSSARLLLSPLPSRKYLLGRQRSVRSLSPAPSMPTWSPRRLFMRRTSPRREVTLVDEQEQLEYQETEIEETADADHMATGQEEPRVVQRPPPPPRLLSSSSASSFSSLSRLGRAALVAGPSYSSSGASQGSRSRDISPESLRRFLVDDVPLEGLSDSCSSTAEGDVTIGVAIPTEESMYEGDHQLTVDADGESHDFDIIDDDEHNFAATSSAVSESAPVTILSPPPSRALTPPRAVDASATAAAEPTSVPLAPEVPSRAPPAIPADAVFETRDAGKSSSQLHLPQLSLTLGGPSAHFPPSPMSLSPMSSLSPTLSFHSHVSHGLSVDEDEGAESLYDAYEDLQLGARDLTALFLPPPEHHFQDAASVATSDSEQRKSESQHQEQQHHRHHLLAAALTDSTTTLVPGNGLVGAGGSSSMNELMDELGWMATAIRS